jgi:protein phosphatase
VSIAWTAFGASDVGRRRTGTEDSYRLDERHGVLLVAAGMGGHAAGEIASELAAATAEEVLVTALEAGSSGDDLEEILRATFYNAHDAISRCCSDDPGTRGMGTTLTACVVDPAGVCRVGHIGDSRLYLLRDGELRQVTTDHTWVQREIDAGKLSPADALSHPLSHIVTRVLSDDLSPEPDVLRLEVRAGDLLLVCSDGLYNMVPEPLLVRLLSSPESLPAVVGSLLDAANEAGGLDNVTAVLARLRAEE